MVALIVALLLVIVMVYVVLWDKSVKWVPECSIRYWHPTPNFKKPLIGWLVSFNRVVFFTDYTPDQVPFGKWIKWLGFQHFISGYIQHKESITAGGRTWITYTIIVKAIAEIEPQWFISGKESIIWGVRHALQNYVDCGDVVSRDIEEAIILRCIRRPRNVASWRIEEILRSSRIDVPQGLTVEIQRPTPWPAPATQPNFTL